MRPGGLESSRGADSREAATRAGQKRSVRKCGITPRDEFSLSAAYGWGGASTASYDSKIVGECDRVSCRGTLQVCPVLFELKHCFAAMFWTLQDMAGTGQEQFVRQREIGTLSQNVTGTQAKPRGFSIE